MATKTFLPSGSIQITNGPGKFDIMISNFDFKKVEITCVENGRQFKLEASIIFACPEDGSKEIWIGMMSLTNPNERFSPEQRAYYYNSKSRRGIISKADKKWHIGTI
jgi:hypothetical protein